MLKWTAASVAQRARLVARTLKQYFPRPEIPLDHKDPFTLFVAVVLSARCTDKLVNKVTPALFKRAANAKTMAKMTPEEVGIYIKKCGLYPAKSKNLVTAAKMIVEKFGGKVPETREELESLPGVGQKTAGVILSQAYGVPAIPVDTHLFRSARRWGLSRAKTPEKVEADLNALFPQKEWTNLHLRMIHYARGHCTARGCEGPGGKTKICPLCRELSKLK